MTSSAIKANNKGNAPFILNNKQNVNNQNTFKMKKSILFIALLTCIVFGASAQGEFSVGADLYNNYVWRGLECSNNPVIQPGIGYSNGGFSIGAWGSYNLSDSKAGNEYDLYAGYGFEELGLSFTVTDYFFQATDDNGNAQSSEYFDYDANHTFELSATKTFGDFYVLGSVYFAQPTGGYKEDLYFETGYSFENFSVFAGAGDKSYSSSTNGDFRICNVGISTSKDIAITEKFSLPMSGSVIVNPDTEQIYFVVGVSF